MCMRLCYYFFAVRENKNDEVKENEWELIYDSRHNDFLLEMEFFFSGSHFLFALTSSYFDSIKRLLLFHWFLIHLSFLHSLKEKTFRGNHKALNWNFHHIISTSYIYSDFRMEILLNGWLFIIFTLSVAVQFRWAARLFESRYQFSVIEAEN